MVLAVLAVLLAAAAPPVRRWRDTAAVRAARDELAAALAATRIAAASAGGASLVLDPAGARFWISTAVSPRMDPTDLGARYRVRVEAGSRGEIVLRYDGLGLGRIASRTIRFERGGAAAGLTVSAYGRYRRW